MGFYELPAALSIVAMALYLYLCHNRNEIRERGIVAYGEFLP
jgi:hypothetical protein